jgi:hypothetical protein
LGKKTGEDALLSYRETCGQTPQLKNGKMHSGKKGATGAAQGTITFVRIK